MSADIALDHIFLRSSARWGHTEYSLNYHTDYLAARTGRSPGDPYLLRAAYDRFAIDLLWHTHDGLIDWSVAGRTTDMGHAAYAADGGDQHAPSVSPFQSPEDVWAFDAVAEYGLPSFEEQVRAYEALIQQARRDFPHQLTTGGYYRTLISGAVAAFGWDMLLLAASDPVRLEGVLDSFFRRAHFHMRAWAATSAEVLIQHDDFVWTSGAFLHPNLYRRILIPRYAEIWRLVHEAGKRVLFCSDGNYLEFADDIAAAGADGFIFEPCMDFGAMVDRFGGTHCLIGSHVDCRDLTFGDRDQVRRDIDRTFERLAGCRGAFLAVGNHLAPNIPPEMMDDYFEALLPRLAR